MEPEEETKPEIVADPVPVSREEFDELSARVERAESAIERMETTLDGDEEEAG